MTVWYVELEKICSYGSEVEADTEEDAQDQVIKWAGGDPRDWKITESHEVPRHGATVDVEVGADKIL